MFKIINKNIRLINNKMEYLFIDGSYYCFYRYFAIITWFKASHKGEELEDPTQNEEFVEKFKKTFVLKIAELIKKCKLNNPKIIIARDCRRENIWRNEVFPEYKATRVYDDSFKGGSFFKMAYEGEELFKKGGYENIVRHESLEADDCIAIMTREVLSKDPTAKITIVTSDTDYLQLMNERVSLINLKLKPVNTSKNSTGQPKRDLFYKIVMGDKSDNIPGVFKKCGIKTAEKYYNDTVLFVEKLKAENAAHIYQRNKILVDFSKIPQELVNNFIERFQDLYL